MRESREALLRCAVRVGGENGACDSTVFKRVRLEGSAAVVSRALLFGARRSQGS